MKNINLIKQMFDFIEEKEGLRTPKKDKYAEFKIGEIAGFKIYKLPKGMTDLYRASCELGSGAEWCTKHSFTQQYWLEYINQDDLYIFIRFDEEYQLFYAPTPGYLEGQFMDKNNHSII